MRLTRLLPIVAIAAMAMLPPQQHAASIRMSVHNRLLLNRAAVNGTARLDVLLLADPTALERLTADIERAAGAVRARDPRIGYLYVDVALENWGKLQSVLSDPTVEAWHLATDSRKAWYRDG